jgi:hypothetical protein
MRAYEHEGQTVQLPAFDVSGRLVWGLTYHMLLSLFTTLRLGTSKPCYDTLSRCPAVDLTVRSRLRHAGFLQCSRVAAAHRAALQDRKSVTRSNAQPPHCLQKHPNAPSCEHAPPPPLPAPP